ncbi:MAG: MerR family transcriptional regulator [Clostridia bacterium]|nr:MerR family transcriptional regulator [Clostridia bacterium]
MKMQIKEFSLLTKVSVRTLHYYDEIGLLKPDEVDRENGYRYYGERAFEKMLEILFLRELGFSLKSIKEILSSPTYNKKEAFRKQKELLKLKKERIEKMISVLEEAEKGELKIMTIDNSYEKTRKQYETEVKEKWGSTDAYKESQQKTATYSKEKWNDVSSGLDEVIAEFAKAKAEGKTAADSTSLAEKLQQYITDNFYTCTKEILAGLGEMYVLDERFKENIDKHGEGTAEFMREAIGIYCR